MIPTKIILLPFLTVCCVRSFQVMFDSVGSCSSTGLFECNMRVRKINRTTAALVGNLSQTEDVGSNFKALIELFHSPLGNNQFYRYPMKIGPIGTCAFLEKFWEVYYEYVVEYIPNVAKPGECPLSARIYEINDWIMDARILPPYVPTGLWRVIQVMWDNSTGQSFTMELIFKVYEDGYF